MKIIVAGCPKTGTKSVNAALKQLGYDVYDFVEHMYCLEKEWAAVFKHGWDDNTFYEMYKSIDAAVDMPASLFWEPMQKAFPDAKIILTVRDSEEIWVESFKNHFRKLDSHILARACQLVEILLGRDTGLLLGESYRFGFHVDRAVLRRHTVINESILKMRYRMHNDRVKQKVPADKLLVFNCKDGWKPLCKFLEVEAPQSEFPRQNVGATIIDETPNHPLALIYQKELIKSFSLFLVKWSLIISLSYCFLHYLF